MIAISDTHALVWFMEGDNRLGENALQVMRSKDSLIIIPSIVLAEISYLYAKKRITTDFKSVLEHISFTKNCLIYPLDEIIIENMPHNLNIHDSLIVATAITFQKISKEPVKILTKDREIQQSKLADTIW